MQASEPIRDFINDNIHNVYSVCPKGTIFLSSMIRLISFGSVITSLLTLERWVYLFNHIYMSTGT